MPGYRGDAKMWNPNPSEMSMSDEESVELKPEFKKVEELLKKLKPKDQILVLNDIKRARENLGKNPVAAMAAAEILVGLYLENSKKDEARQKLIESSSGMDPKQFARELAEFERIAERYAELEENVEAEKSNNLADDLHKRRNMWLDEGPYQSHGKHGRNPEPPYSPSHLRNPDNVQPTEER